VINSCRLFYVGAGLAQIGGDQRFTLSLGAAIGVLLSDYLSFELELKDNLFNSELMGQEKTRITFNIWFGATFFF